MTGPEAVFSPVPAFLRESGLRIPLGHVIVNRRMAIKRVVEAPISMMSDECLLGDDRLGSWTMTIGLISFFDE